MEAIDERDRTEAQAELQAEAQPREETPSQAESRRLTYLFLSRMFLEEVTADFLEQMGENPPLGEGELAAYAAGFSGADLEAARRDAAADFAALLLNMSADPVFPYESVYTSSEHLMMQAARDEVLAAYRAEGFSRGDAVNVPEDHAGIELEFMARLCERERDAQAAGDRAVVLAVRESERAFLRDHVLRWMPDLCRDLKQRAKTGLYRGLAETTQTFLDFERDDLIS